MFCFFTVAKNGDVCISILHEPGEDKFGYEKPEERWLPIHTVETIMISVISMLADPNSDSPANVDAAVSYAAYQVPRTLVIHFQFFSGQVNYFVIERVCCSHRKSGGRTLTVNSRGRWLAV